jgi:hypothetical protein
MPAQVNISNVDAATQSIYITGFIVLSGNYATGGDPLNFTGSGTLPVGQDPSFVGLLAALEGTAILNVDVWSMNGSTINGANSTNYSPACTKTGTPALISPATGVKLKTAALSATPSTEHAAAAYESQYTGDLIAFMAVATKLL